MGDLGTRPRDVSRTKGEVFRVRDNMADKVGNRDGGQLGTSTVILRSSFGTCEFSQRLRVVWTVTE